VVAAQVFGVSGTIRLRLKEPCDAIAANVREALGAKGHRISRFDRTSG